MRKAIENAQQKLTLLQYGDKSNETGGNFQAPKQQKVLSA
jgi:hypothetical protein